MVRPRMKTGEGQPARSPDGEALPRSFGRYVLFDHIGRGGMADIFLARMRTGLGGGRNVVVKQVLPHLGGDAAFRAMLTDEAKLAAQLNHANVVQVFDFGEEGERLFIAMDYVEGFDLADMLKRLSRGRIPLPAEFAIFVVREVLRALDYAHRAKDERGAPLGIVHRDVSPSNVLVSFEGEVKLCDFGIARALEREGDEATVRRVRVAGKSAYMAPEHALGGAVDARSDLFAAGILLWELCAGRRLYKGRDEETLKLAQAAEVPRLPDRNLPAPEGLQRVLDKALARDPGARFASCAAFLEALETWAIEAKLMASPLRFGAFLTEHFAAEIVSLRRARERAAGEIVGDADPSTFGPSSTPPPAREDHEEPARVLGPPRMPSDLVPTMDELAHARTEGLDAVTSSEASSHRQGSALVPPEPSTSGETPDGAPGLAVSGTELSATARHTKPRRESAALGLAEVPSRAVSVESARVEAARVESASVETASVESASVETASVESARVGPADEPVSAVSARPALVPFTPSWYALVVVGAVVFGGLVYLVVRAAAS